MTPEEHAKVCQEARVVKTWSMQGRTMGNPPHQFSVTISTTLYQCGHRVVTSEREWVS